MPIISQENWKKYFKEEERPLNFKDGKSKRGRANIMQ